MKHATWENLLENLGSDHYILKTTIAATNIKRKLGTAKITNWPAFRKACADLEGGITSIDDWCQQLKDIQKRYTQEVDRTEQTPEVDPRLIRLWEARRGLTKRWKKQRFNRKLKLKIAEVTKIAEEYATQLARQSWQQFSSSLDAPSARPKRGVYSRPSSTLPKPGPKAGKLSADSSTPSRVRKRNC